jgi:hypothetical protein
MYLTVHATIGALIATQTDNPALAFGAGFASHFLFDFIPHGDEKVGEMITSHKAKFIFVASVDLVLTICLTVLILAMAGTFGQRHLILLAGIIGAVLPDFISMAFPEFHKLLKNNRIVAFWYRALRWIYIPQAAEQLNKFHHWIHSIILRRTGFKLSFPQGLVLQLAFLSLLLAKLFN